MTIAELKKDLADKKPVIGLKSVLKKLVKEELSKVYTSSNCKDKETLKRYCNLYSIKLVELEQTNKDIGIACKKSYNIGVLGFSKK